MKLFETPTMDERAVSPVLGVALLVAMTVILAGVIGFVVLGVDSGSSDAPQPSLEFHQSSSDVTMVHEGGDPIDTSRVEVVVNKSERNDLNAGTIETGDEVALNGSTTSDVTLAGTNIRIVWNDPDSDRKVQLAEYTVE